MYKSRSYNISQSNTFSNYDNFKASVFQKVKRGWKRAGNEYLGIDDAKVHRIFTGKQKDFDTIMRMAEFMQMKFEFKMLE